MGFNFYGITCFERTKTGLFFKIIQQLQHYSRPKETFGYSPSCFLIEFWKNHVTARGSTDWFVVLFYGIFFYLVFNGQRSWSNFLVISSLWKHLTKVQVKSRKWDLTKRSKRPPVYWRLFLFLPSTTHNCEKIRTLPAWSTCTISLSLSLSLCPYSPTSPSTPFVSHLLLHTRSIWLWCDISNPSDTVSQSCSHVKNSRSFMLELSSTIIIRSFYFWQRCANCLFI